MEISGGENLSCIPQLIKKLNAESEDDVNTEKERFKAMCFLLRSYEKCYSELIEDLKKVS